MFLTPKQMEMWSDGEMQGWLLPFRSLGEPWAGGSRSLQLELSSRGDMAFPLPPSLEGIEGIAAQLGHPPFLKGTDVPSCLGTRFHFQG